MLYISMLDEIDEDAASFRGSNMPPVDSSNFGTLEDLPSDMYLRITGGRRTGKEKVIQSSADSTISFLL